MPGPATAVPSLAGTVVAGGTSGSPCGTAGGIGTQVSHTWSSAGMEARNAALCSNPRDALCATGWKHAIRSMYRSLLVTPLPATAARLVLFIGGAGSSRRSEARTQRSLAIALFHLSPTMDRRPNSSASPCCIANQMMWRHGSLKHVQNWQEQLPLRDAVCRVIQPPTPKSTLLECLLKLPSSSSSSTITLSTAPWWDTVYRMLPLLS